MTIKEMAFKIEDLENQAEKINSFQNTLFEAIYKGDNAVSTYKWAFVAFGDLTHDMLKQLTELTNDVFELLRNEKKGAV